MKNVTSENIHKLCKVVNLAFRKADLEQEILFHYLMELLQEYQTSIELADSSQQDLNLQKDKFKGILQKLPVKYLMEHE
jgi:hypothetical protein